MNLGAVKGDWKVGNGQACALALLSLSGPEQWPDGPQVWQNTAFLVYLWLAFDQHWRAQGMPKDRTASKYSSTVQAIALICLAHFSRKFRGTNIFPPPRIKSSLFQFTQKGRKDSSCLFLLSAMLKRLPYNMVFHKGYLTHSWAPTLITVVQYQGDITSSQLLYSFVTLVLCSAFEGHSSGCRMGVIIHVFLLQDTVKCTRLITEIKIDQSFPLFGLHILGLIIYHQRGILK